MPQPIPKIKNVDALPKRDLTKDGGEGEDNQGRHLRPWPGKVTQDRGEKEQNGYLSGEWEVEITSKFLEDPVVARVNSVREEGTLVQFHLDPSDATGTTAVTFFQSVHTINPRTNEASEPTENSSWHKDRFSDSDY